MPGLPRLRPRSQTQIRGVEKMTEKRISLKDQGAFDIERLWGEVEVVDALENLRVMILPEDVEKAVRQDPACCVFAQACRRQFGSSKVLFYRTLAYADLRTEDGNVRAE